VQGIATIVLVGVTWRYVKMTNVMVNIEKERDEKIVEQEKEEKEKEKNKPSLRDV